MNYHWIGFFLYLWKIDVELVIYLIISDIIQINKFLGAMHIDLRHLPAAKTSLRLGIQSHGT
jgi:hypothetical protein